MARAVRTPRTPRGGASPARRSHAGRLAAAAIGVATAAGYGWEVGHVETPPTSQTAFVEPNDATTPGATDPAVRDAAAICAHDWKQGPPGSPPVKGGADTYSQAGRHTSASVKEQAYENYGLTDPKDNGASYEVDHRVPLSLGGRDLIQNLWPQSRTAPGFNAWKKDALELRLYKLVCQPKPNDPKVALAQAQQVFLGDWIKSYDTYCPDETTCPTKGGGEGD